MRRVIVKDHDPAWEAEYERESARLVAVLGDNVLACHHIGSTAIPTIGAKPVIDILLVVSSLDLLDARNETMIGLGYLPKGENGIAGRRYYRKGSDELHTHHVHAFAKGHPDIARHLAFRDYMRTHPKAAREYDRLKRELAARYPLDIGSYIDGKDAFIKEIDRQAAAWRKSTLDREK